MEKNIFEAATKQLLNKKKTASQGTSASKALPSKSSDSFEITEMIEKIEAMQHDLEEKMAYLYAKGRSCHLNVDALFDCRSLSNKELCQLKEQEEQLLKKIEEITPPESCLKPAHTPKSEEKLAKERKSKTRGVRRNWLPMR